MKKAELKAVLKPLIKECIKESLIEEGLLSNVVAEVMKGMQQNTIVETRAPAPRREEPVQMQRQAQDTRRKMTQHRQKLMESIGKDAYNGVDLFENTEPLRKGGRTNAAPSQGDVPSVLGDNPSDAGVDISSIFGNSGKIWQAMK